VDDNQRRPHQTTGEQSFESDKDLAFALWYAIGSMMPGHPRNPNLSKSSKAQALRSIAHLASGVLLSFLHSGVAAAQPPPSQVPVQLPPAEIFPNYDNVLPGKVQALEGGAYIARVGDASANFYNPAGLVQQEKTELDASSTGWLLTNLSSDALNTSVSSSRFDNVPGYIGAVIGAPFITSRDFRIGLSLTRLASWSPGNLDVSSTNTGVAGLDRLTYSASSSFSTLLYQAAAAWAPPVENRSLRLGASAGVTNTNLSSVGTLSGLVTAGGMPGQFLGTLRANGQEWDLIFGAGAQWDVVAGLTVGAILHSPALRMSNGSLLTYESNVLATTAPPQSSFFYDTTGDFHYKLPIEAGVGFAYSFKNGQIEADLRYHAPVSMYDLYTTKVPLSLTTLSGQTSSLTTQPAPLIQYSARQVFNFSVGGNYKLGERTAVHGGFYTSTSPVHADTPLFRSANLYGVTGGVDFQFDHFGASLGAGYEWGRASSTPISVVGHELQGGDGVSLKAISILYAISYSF
jgi:hypothetical protein